MEDPDLELRVGEGYFPCQLFPSAIKIRRGEGEGEGGEGGGGGGGQAPPLDQPLPPGTELTDPLSGSFS